MNQQLIESLRKNPPASALELVRVVQTYVKSDDVISVIENIAAGADGISGTDDDLVPSAILETLRVLLKHKVVHELASEFVSSAPSCGCFN